MCFNTLFVAWVSACAGPNNDPPGQLGMGLPGGGGSLFREGHYLAPWRGGPESEPEITRTKNYPPTALKNGSHQKVMIFWCQFLLGKSNFLKI